MGEGRQLTASKQFSSEEQTTYQYTTTASSEGDTGTAAGVKRSSSDDNSMCYGQGHRKLFTTGQAKLNSEHYVIKCVGGRYI